MMATSLLTALLALPALSSATCTSEQDFALHGPSIATQRGVASYGACCDACIQHAGCSHYSWAPNKTCELKSSDAGRIASEGMWSGWAGTGPAPPPPSPPVPPGQWSAEHKSVSCEQSGSKYTKELGRGVPLSKCKAACVADPKCFYINYAGESDKNCVLYGSCATPGLCGHTGWDVFQYGRAGSVPWNSTCKGGGSPPSPPGPPAPSPSDPDSFECKVRHFAMEYAAHIMGGASISAVAASLGFGGGCVQAHPSSALLGRGRLAETLPPLPRAAATFYVDAVKGSDSNTGTTVGAPFKSLEKAQAAVRAAKASATTVFLRAGTFFLSKPLRFGPSDSSLSNPVTWAAYQNEEVVLSGGVDLSGLKWSPASSGGTGAFSATVPASAAASGFATLFVNGKREIRAKFPNGDPLIPGGAGWGAKASGGLGTFGATGIAFEQTVSVLDSTGRLLSQGASQDGLAHNFTIGAEVTPHMTGRGYNPTRQDFHAYYNYSAERFNNTWNSPFWNSQVSPGFSTASLAGAAKKWANPATGVVHMYHTGRWGGWQYQVSTRDTSAAADSGGTGGGAPAAATDSIMFACRQLSDGKRVTCPAPSGRDVQSASERYVIDGGFQECRGANIGSNQFYVENIEEELDDTREWFLKGTTLTYIPANGTDVSAKGTRVVGAVLKRVIEVEGAAALTLRGMTITHTAPTYMDSYEYPLPPCNTCPSGGDWSIHRGGAVFVESSSNITLEGLSFDQVSGNGVVFSNEVDHSTVRRCNFTEVGDSAIAMLGSTCQMIGTKGAGLFPAHNTIEGNLVDTVGVYGKQTSAYFKAKARENTVRNNIFMNGPRAGVNFNDGSAGGEVLEGNLIMNFVRETGDHGMFNSWDRQPVVHDEAGSEGTAAALNPQTHQIRRNLIFNKNWLGSTNSGYSIDYDDGSSQYNATHNFLVFGAFKVRDGINRHHSHNLIYGKPADYQCDGFNSTTMQYNTIIGQDLAKISYGCVGSAFGAKGSYNSVQQDFNTYYGAGLNACGKSLSQLQAAGYDTHSTLTPNITVDAIIAMARAMLIVPG